MSKRILVKESSLGNFFRSFFKAKASGNESGWLQSLRKQDPKLADIWKDYDTIVTQGMINQKRELTKLGIDTSHIDAFMKKYGRNIS